MGVERYASLPCRSYDTRCEAWLGDLASAKSEAEYFDQVLNQVFVRLGLEIESNPVFQDLWIGLIMAGIYRSVSLDPRLVRLASSFALQLAQKPFYLKTFPDPQKRREALLEESLMMAEWNRDRELGKLGSDRPTKELAPSAEGEAVDYVSNRFIADLSVFYEKEIPNRIYFTAEQQVQYRKFSLTGGLSDAFQFWIQLFTECVGFRASFFFDHANSDRYVDIGHFLIFASDSASGRLKSPLWFLECLEDWSERNLERFERLFASSFALWMNKYRALFGREAASRVLEGILQNPSLHDQDKGRLPERWLERYKSVVRSLWEENAREDPPPRLVALRGVLSHEGSSVSFPIIQALADESEPPAADDAQAGITAELLNETLDYFYAENLSRIRKDDDVGERYLGLVFYGIELELEIEARHLKEAAEVARILQGRGEYLAKWDDPDARSRALQWEERGFRDSVTQ